MTTRFAMRRSLGATSDEALVRGSIDRTKTVPAAGEPKLAALAKAVKERLERALGRLA